MSKDNPSSYNISTASINKINSPLVRKLSSKHYDFIKKSRQIIDNIITGKDKRFLIILGPCSIHDYNSAIEYATALAELNARYQDKLYLVMRCYVEKSRTNVGWKGILLDPDLDGSFNIDKGLDVSLKLFQAVTDLNLPIATELINPVHMHLLQDYVSWGAVGARACESQIHRELASGLAFPVAFKNRADGNIAAAVNSIIAAKESSLLYFYQQDNINYAVTKGNKAAHLVLRGGTEPNYYLHSILKAHSDLLAKDISTKIVVDCSHGNSGKSYQNQKKVVQDIIDNFRHSADSICGLMLESFIYEGNQNINHPLSELNYGQSVTDECIGLEETKLLLSLIYSCFFD